MKCIHPEHKKKCPHYWERDNRPPAYLSVDMLCVSTPCIYVVEQKQDIIIAMLKQLEKKI